MHTQFRIPIHGYLSAFTTTNNILQTLKHANVIIIDVMSIITSIIYVMCNKTTLKQTHDTMNPFTNVFLLLLVGDLGQLLAICKYFYLKKELYNKFCHISMAPCWLNAIHHTLQISMRHITNPILLQFLNMIGIKQPTQNKIDMYIQVIIF
jgi:hypothetical protein